MSDELDLAGIWAMLEELMDAGALGATAVFPTAHGMVFMTTGPNGRVMQVNGERVPMES